jgi:hypothetical protein
MLEGQPVFIPPKQSTTLGVDMQNPQHLQNIQPATAKHYNSRYTKQIPEPQYQQQPCTSSARTPDPLEIEYKNSNVSTRNKKQHEELSHNISQIKPTSASLQDQRTAPFLCESASSDGTEQMDALTPQHPLIHDKKSATAEHHNIPSNIPDRTPTSVNSSEMEYRSNCVAIQNDRSHGEQSLKLSETNSTIFIPRNQTTASTSNNPVALLKGETPTSTSHNDHLVPQYEIVQHNLATSDEPESHVSTKISSSEDKGKAQKKDSKTKTGKQPFLYITGLTGRPPDPPKERIPHRI